MEFELLQFNNVRFMRGVPAAKVAFDIGNGDTDWKWMTLSNIKKNIEQFGEHPELLKAKAEYTKRGEK